ncbi:hypothetical protein JCM3770_002775 [Rhodotorula araucariae]
MGASPATAPSDPAALAARPSSPPAPPPPPSPTPSRPQPDSDNDDDFDDTYGPPRPEAGVPSFFPPLWLARRTACMHLLQADGAKSVVDHGCGSGAVLSLLALPAYHRDEFPSHAPKPSPPAELVVPAHHKAQKIAVIASLPPPLPHRRGLHLSRLVGVDADLSACDRAAKVCAPPSRDDKTEPRWEELRTEVWHGGVEVYNGALEGVDAFVMTEVIEHLTPSALARFPSLLFSVYKPRLVIITTPNHAFNPYFPLPSSSSSSASRPTWSRNNPATDEGHPSHLFPDPTGRTARVFRDATHTLEWTPSEFQAWCTNALRSAGAEDVYDVEHTGVGSLEAYYRPCGDGTVPFPPPSLALHPALAEHPLCTARPEDPRSVFATQIAVFRRRQGPPPGPGAGAGGEQDRYGKGREEEKDDDDSVARSADDHERPSRSPHVSPINTYSPLPPVPPSASSTPDPAPVSAPRAPHALVATATHPAHPAARACASAGPPASPAALRQAVRAAFRRARRGECMSIDEVWRADAGRGETEGEGEGEGEGERERRVRALARGEVGALVDALLADDHDDDDDGGKAEWAFERLVADEGRRELRGWEALGVRWRRYDAEVAELERAEAEEDRRWAEAATREREDPGDGCSADDDQEEERGVGKLLAHAPERGDKLEQETRPSATWSMPHTERRLALDEEEVRASWNAADERAGAGWGDDPW